MARTWRRQRLGRNADRSSGHQRRQEVWGVALLMNCFLFALELWKMSKRSGIWGLSCARNELPLQDDLIEVKPPYILVKLHARRQILCNGTPKEQGLVSWSDGSIDVTWEPLATIQQSFPHLHLENKVNSEGRESDITASTQGETHQENQEHSTAVEHA
ncbi:unnamed protein product [Cuscuta campestris]|uniref:Chromo domain-containing protein n=1 Tax=Cuscuta campestris TaxID=132261 RepID=A0A484MTG0_9ASTE|nr:unnamed protein product [Cuscuta campestris]